MPQLQTRWLILLSPHSQTCKKTIVLWSPNEEKPFRAHVGDLPSSYPEKFQGTGLLTGSLISHQLNFWRAIFNSPWLPQKSNRSWSSNQFTPPSSTFLLHPSSLDLHLKTPIFFYTDNLAKYFTSFLPLGISLCPQWENILKLSISGVKNFLQLLQHYFLIFDFLCNELLANHWHNLKSNFLSDLWATTSLAV